MKPLELKNYSDYSSVCLAKANTLSPAIERYIHLLNQPSLPPLYAKRHRAWVNCALGTLLESHSPKDICAHYSATADTIVSELWHTCGLDHHEVLLVALGKWGAMELNLSSDIDFILVSKNPPDTEMLKALQKFISALSQQSEFGFLFRVDTFLRPGGRLGPLVSSLSQNEDYYWSQGATWERLALARRRFICGHQTLWPQIDELYEKFCYRKYSDFQLFDELKQLRSKIHLPVPVYEQRVHLKLAPGGIRDIELYINSLQIIHGGKKPTVRTHSTHEAITKLIALDIYPKEELEFLIQTYWELRQKENWVQAINDAQTHEMTFENPLEFNAQLEQCQKVNALVSNIIGKISHSPVDRPVGLEESIKWLTNKGFSESRVNEVWPKLLHTSVHSQNPQRDESRRLECLYLFVENISKYALDRDLGLSLLHDFFKSVRSKSGFYSLFLQEPQLIEDLSVLLGSSPFLANLLCSRPELIDSYFYRNVETPLGHIDDVIQSLTEKKLLNQLISSTQFLKKRDIFALFQNLSFMANEVCALLLEELRKEYPQATIQILCLGKWGTSELGLKSDLDFIFLTDTEPTYDDHKLAKRYISRLTDPQKGGKLFNIDLRLRPTGNAGPLLVQRNNLQSFLVTAPAWVRQSYLKSKMLNGENCEWISESLRLSSLTELDLEDLRSIRIKLFKEKNIGQNNIKYAPGGLVHIELALETIALSTKKWGPTNSVEQLTNIHNLNYPNLSRLSKNYYELKMVQQLSYLISSSGRHNLGKNEIESIGPKIREVFKFLDETYIQNLLFTNNQLLKSLDPCWVEH